MFLKELINFGLTENEAKIYLISLGLGKTLASILSKKSGINRSTVYSVAVALVQRGLFGASVKNNITYFYAIDPKKLLSIGEETINQQKEKIKNISLILPELSIMAKKKHESMPNVRYVEGEVHIRDIYQDIISNQNYSMYSFVSLKCIKEGSFSFLKERFNKKRIQNNISHHIILPEQEKDLSRIIPDELVEKRFIKNNDFNFNSVLHLFKNKIVFLNFDSTPNSIVIEKNIIFESLKSVFDHYWEKAYR